jgi:hypothetical protein
MTDPSLPIAAPPDLLTIEAQQRALYSALADYQQAQAGEAYVVPGAFGLAVYHTATTTGAGGGAIEACLVHAHGGMLTSGEVPIPDWQQHTIIEVRRITGAMVLGLPLNAPGLDDVALFKASTSAKKQASAPQLQQQAIASSSSGGGRTPTVQNTPIAEPAPEPDPAPVVAAAPEPPAAADPPSDDEVAAVMDALDRIHARDEAATKGIVTSFRNTFAIGRVPFARAITTRERIDWLTGTIDEVERNLQAASEVAA